jgi:MFS family permease
MEVVTSTDVTRTESKAPRGSARSTATRSGEPPSQAGRDDSYKWVVLINTTIGVLMATINASILLIALPDIFRGIGIDPLAPGNTSYFLWILMGFMLVTSVLVVSLGRVGDMFGRVRCYNLGFAVFTGASVLLAVTWMHGDAAALWIIFVRVIQGVGGAMLMANSSAIITDAFPANERGLALGVNGVAAIAGSFLGLLIGGLLAPIEWHLVFVVSVPFGILGTAWAYLKLKDNGVRTKARIDWAGNLTFAVGLIGLLVGIVYGLQPYGGHTMGWTNPFVLSSMIGGVVVLIAFCFIETRVSDPMFAIELFRDRGFLMGTVTGLLGALARGGLQFMLIIWLQGIWLPLHGYSFASTPLWAGIYLIPMTVGFLVSGPIAGRLSDRYGARPFATVGMVVSAVGFAVFDVIPIDFSYVSFALALLLIGLSMGLFAAPNTAAVMNGLPADRRGAGAGMLNTAQNSAQVLSIGVFFTVIGLGLAASLPRTLYDGLTGQGISSAKAHEIAGIPPVGSLFSAFLGYNPIQQLLGSSTLSTLPAAKADYLTGHEFFPRLIAGPFGDGLHLAFAFAALACLLGAVASWLRGGPDPHAHRSVTAEAAAGLAAAGDIAAAEAGVGGVGGVDPAEATVDELEGAVRAADERQGVAG